MPAIGKNALLVDLLYKKTKVKKEDIVDIFRALPECMAEAFIQSNLEDGKPIDLGGVSIRWKRGGMWGTYLVSRMTENFKDHLTRLKIEGKHPLAIQLFNLMHPKNKESALRRHNNSSRSSATH